MNKSIISGFLLVALIVSVIPTSIMAEESYTGYTQKQIQASCRAFRDPEQNDRNIQRLEKIKQKDAGHLIAQERKIAQAQKKILNLETKIRDWQDKDNKLSIYLTASGLWRLQTLTKRMTAYEEKAQMYRMQIREISLFIHELKKEQTPSFCPEIYQAKKKKAVEATYRGEHRGFTAYNSLTRADFEYMRAQGISQVRIMFMDGDLVKASHLQNPDNLDPAILPKNLEQLDRLVSLGREYGVRLVIDVHEIPGLTRWFTGGDKIRNMSMWEQNAHGNNYRGLLIDIWEQLARHLQDEPAEAVSYELMNEPEPKTDFAPQEIQHRLWTDLQDRLIRVIRQHDQTHLIFATPAYGWRLSALQEWFPSETVMNDPNLAVSIHSARPFKYVYQALAWYGSAEYAAYPGYFDEEHYGYEYWDRERLSQLFAATIGKFYQQYGLKIYICEFSVMREAPGAAAYFEDLISLMNRDFGEAIWGWTAHVYGEAEYVTGKGLVYDTSRPGMYDFSHDPELSAIVLAGISSKTTKK